MTDPNEGYIVIIGSGLIGRSWAMVFASGGFRVRLYDIEKEQVAAAREDIRKQMDELTKSGMLRGSLNVDQQISLISGSSDLKTALEGAIFIQECVPENLELKLKIFSDLDVHVNNTAIISSSTSCLSPTKMFNGLRHVKNCIVAHPDGVITPKDVDIVMSEGLGMRYAFLGPLETAHLNAEGFKSYCERYGEGIQRVLATFGPVPNFSGDVAEQIDQALWDDQPDKSDQLKARREWRDACLSHLAKLKKEMKK